MNFLKANFFRLLCLLLAGYFLYAFHSVAGFPPSSNIEPSSVFLLVVSIFFFLLPFSGKLKLGKFLEYEAKIDRIEHENREFRAEIRQSVTLQANLINAVSNTANQNINIQFPWEGQAKEAKEDLDETIKEPTEPSTLEDELQRILLQSDNDTSYALAKLRMELESKLRNILGLRVDTPVPSQVKGKFLSARALFRKFVASYPTYEGMESSFDFILQVCNAAIHGQRVSDKYAHEALRQGVRMLEQFKRIEGEL
jgi:hypothetical protein